MCFLFTVCGWKIYRGLLLGTGKPQNPVGTSLWCGHLVQALLPLTGPPVPPESLHDLHHICLLFFIHRPL